MAGSNVTWFKRGGGAKGREAVRVPGDMMRQLAYKTLKGDAFALPLTALRDVVQARIDAGDLPMGSLQLAKNVPGAAQAGGVVSFTPTKGLYGPAGWSLAAPIQDALKGRFRPGAWAPGQPRLFAGVPGAAVASMVAAMPAKMRASRQNESPTVASFGKLAAAFPEIAVGGWYRAIGDEVSLDTILIPAGSPNLSAIRSRIAKMQLSEADVDGEPYTDAQGNQFIRYWWD